MAIPDPLKFETQRLFGLDFVSDATIDAVADAVVRAATGPATGWRCVVTPNVDHLVRYDRNPREAEAARHACVVLPDGMPIVWASRLLGRPLKMRLAGSDLFGALWSRLAASSVPTVVVASRAEVADRLRESHAQAQTLVPVQFDVGDEPAVTSVIDWIDEAVARGGRVVIVGVSMPKHHLIANRLRERWADLTDDIPIVLLMGASADLSLGLARRAPRWMQRFGLEWLFRLALEPRRLARRYLVDDMKFMRLLGREWRATRGVITK
jgi:N-acetylglucosaminyldiphosphoundecaprenol N-acetyl-beta-D-mannosaminyltransferase